MTDFQSISWAPFYHPSGEYVIFTSNKLGFSNFELFIVDAEGKREPIRVTFTDGFDGLPVFTPDGRKLSWASARTEDGSPQIFIADWNHEAAQGELAQAPSKARPAADPMKHSRPALAFLILVASLALLSRARACGHVSCRFGGRPSPHGGVFGFRRIGRPHDRQQRLSPGRRLSRLSTARSWASARRRQGDVFS